MSPNAIEKFIQSTDGNLAEKKLKMVEQLIKSYFEANQTGTTSQTGTDICSQSFQADDENENEIEMDQHVFGKGDCRIKRILTDPLSGSRVGRKRNKAPRAARKSFKSTHYDDMHTSAHQKTDYVYMIVTFFLMAKIGVTRSEERYLCANFLSLDDQA